MPNYFKGVGFLIQIEDSANPGTFINLACARSNSNAKATEPIDVTSKCSMPNRTLIEGGIQTMTWSGSGVMNDGNDMSELIAYANAGNIVNMKFISDYGDEYAGAFLVAAFTREGEYNDAEMFDATFESSGAITYTAPAP